MTVTNVFDTESHAVAELATVLSRCIVPIFKSVEAKLSHHGSGFLVSYGNNSFLVSAAHVFDCIRDGDDLFFYIKPKILRKITGHIRLTRTPKGADRRADRFDVGVLKLEGQDLPPYPEVHKYPLKIDGLMAEALPRGDKEYLLLGFPGSKSKINAPAREVTSSVYAFRNVSAPLGKYANLGVAPDSHIVLSFDREKAVARDGRIQTFPDPAGMSGSPVWLLNDGSGRVDPTQTPVVGVAIEHCKTCRVIVATDVGLALTLIKDPGWPARDAARG
jgi:hypothetical protein